MRDGVGAVATYEFARPECVLMDIRLKQMDGLTATQQNAHPAARIPIVTSFNDARLRHAAGRAKACGYLLKETSSIYGFGWTTQTRLTRIRRADQ